MESITKLLNNLPRFERYSSKRCNKKESSSRGKEYQKVGEIGKMRSDDIVDSDYSPSPPFSAQQKRKIGKNLSLGSFESFAVDTWGTDKQPIAYSQRSRSVDAETKSSRSRMLMYADMLVSSAFGKNKECEEAFLSEVSLEEEVFLPQSNSADEEQNTAASIAWFLRKTSVGTENFNQRSPEEQTAHESAQRNRKLLQNEESRAGNDEVWHEKDMNTGGGRSNGIKHEKYALTEDNTGDVEGESLASDEEQSVSDTEEHSNSFEMSDVADGIQNIEYLPIGNMLGSPDTEKTTYAVDYEELNIRRSSGKAKDFEEYSSSEYSYECKIPFKGKLRVMGREEEGYLENPMDNRSLLKDKEIKERFFALHYYLILVLKQLYLTNSY